MPLCVLEKHNNYLQISCGICHLRHQECALQESPGTRLDNNCCCNRRSKLFAVGMAALSCLHRCGSQARPLLFLSVLGDHFRKTHGLEM